METKKMNVEIWSDITCPHCYTAKRKLEQALSTFKHKDRVAITWRSFELAPGFITDAMQRLPALLAQLHGTGMEQTHEMINQLTLTVKAVGLDFQLEKAIPANSFNAHRVSHLAKAHQLQHRAEEKLFSAYFTEGKNIDDIQTLIELGSEIGLDADEVRTMLESEQFVAEVKQDIEAARLNGVTRVPHFVFNGQTSLSGSRESQEYADRLEKSFAQWELENLLTHEVSGAGQSCTIGEACS